MHSFHVPLLGVKNGFTAIRYSVCYPQYNIVHKSNTSYS